MTTITVDQIRKAAAFARFGEGVDPARVVCEGLLSIAAGFRTGYTVHCILMDLKLVGFRGRTLTKLGRLFLFDMYRDADPLAGISGTDLAHAASPAQGDV